MISNILELIEEGKIDESDVICILEKFISYNSVYDSRNLREFMFDQVKSSIKFSDTEYSSY